MWNDPIVEEVRKTREEHAARFDYDLEKIFQDLKEQERQSNRKVVSLPPKRPLEVAADQASAGKPAAGE